ncbi:histone deacetylase 8 [Crucibulum laeve]|uniref:histone deacetylase n=1 Tax=Crucibulum laeve TaxID=68775 RepID=A0A5C3MAT4_9AGAR|nr:histone deacetylase 8 [Crucibulum laeve]
MESTDAKELNDKKTVAYIASSELVKVSSLLPSNKKRSMIVHSLISSLGLMKPDFSTTSRLQVINPRRATYKELAVYHSRDYLDFVLEARHIDSSPASLCTGTNTEFGLEDDCPPFSGLPDYVRLVAGATLTAADALRQETADVAICWDGGRHHAQKSHASGFCYIADCILAIMSLKRPYPAFSAISPHSRRPRIMYLDLDLHFSDAVSEAFSSRAFGAPQILTLSVHHAAPGFFPASPRAQLTSVADQNFDPFSLSIPLLQGASNNTYARIWPIIEKIKDSFDPDFVVVQCGTDGLAGDPCATFNWSLGDDAGSLGWCIQRVLKGWSKRTLLLGGGGYNSPNAARAWAYLTSIALERPIDLETEIPDHVGFPLYGPSFTMDVSPGNMHNHNSDEYLGSIENKFEDIIVELQKRLENSTNVTTG